MPVTTLDIGDSVTNYSLTANHNHNIGTQGAAASVTNYSLTANHNSIKSLTMS